MKYDSSWLISEYIIYNKMYDKVTPEHILKLVEHNVQMIEASEETHPIHIIYDMRKTSLQGSIIGFQRNSNMMFRHNRMGWLLLVNDPSNLLVNVTASIVSHVFHTQFREFYTIDEALGFLKKNDPNLSDISKHKLSEPSY